jgi:PAS domain S-box-containing protein
MDISTQGRDLQTLRQRQGAMAETWYRAIGHPGYVPLPADQVRARLADLTREVITLFLAESLDRERAEQVGKALVDLHLVQAEALDRTVEVLGRELVAGQPETEAAQQRMRLAELLGAVAAGYFRHACRAILGEQEAIRNALVSELQAKGQQLRQARDELEVRVQERTAELARANEELRAEIAVRRRAEQGLRQSEEKYRLLVESFQDGVYALDMEGRFTFVNEVIVQRFGWSREELLGRSTFDLMRPEDRSRVRGNFEAIIRGEEVPIYELAYVNAEGREVWLELNTSALRVAGEIVGAQGVSRDVTKRKRAEQALQESEERWRSLVENVPDLVISVDRGGQVLYINRVDEQAAETVQDIIGTDLLSWVQSGFRPALREAIDAAFEGRRSGYFELIASGASGGPVWHAVRVGPIWREGRVASAMLVARDIREQKEIQEIKDNLIRDVSHELRNPLAKVRMSLDLLAEIVEAEPVNRERAARIGQLAMRNVDRLLRTVEGILDLSRLESGIGPIRDQAIVVEELVEEAMQHMAPLALAANLDLEARLPDEGLPTIMGDRDRLFRVLVNLIDNAIKFTTEGQVVVSAQLKDSLAEVAVADTGQGIEPHVLEHVFDRFYQEKAQAEGVGIGLTICRAVVQAHGGRIWGESAGKGQGATFRFTLPLGSKGSEA